ncbi:MAG TPA: cytochrome c [Gemmataceae bacterium]|jgi:hypothetical protein|nr:cytochrome c [Gemmataceae bacterium]
MRTHARLLVAGVLVPALGFGLLAAGDSPGPPVLPETALAVVVKEAVKNIEKPADKMTAKRIRANAFMVAVAAQDAMLNKGADARRLATLRDAAIRLAKAAAGKRVNQAEAKKEAAVLASFPNIEPAADAKTDPVDLKDEFELADVMRVFDKANKGGQGVELQLVILQQQKRPYTPKQMADFETSAYKTAMIAALSRGQDEKATTKADKKQWQQWSDNMQKLSLELLQASGARDSKHFKVTLRKLSDSCASCHEKFK